MPCRFGIKMPIVFNAVFRPFPAVTRGDAKVVQDPCADQVRRIFRLVLPACSPEEAKTSLKQRRKDGTRELF